jgi:hypothetical protein
MHSNRFAAVLGAAVLAGAVALTGCASGQPAPATTGPANTTATTTAGITAAPAGGPVHIAVWSVNSDGPDFQAIVTGAIGDYGPAVTIDPDGTVDPQHTSQASFRLRNGSFRLNIASLDRKIVYATGHWPKYSPTSSFHLSVTAPVPVVAGSGTGAYRRISGSLTMTAVIDEVDTTHTNAGGAFLAQIIVMTGSGTVSFG